METIKQTLQTLRSKLTNERKRYADLKHLMAVYYPNEWEICAEALRVVAGYYHSEIVRCKHDTADYMRGHDVEADYGNSAEVDDLHRYLEELPGLLDKAGQTEAEEDLGAVEDKIQVIVETMKFVEAESYGQ